MPCSSVMNGRAHKTPPRLHHYICAAASQAKELVRPRDHGTSLIDSYVQVTIHVPDGPWVPNLGSGRKSTLRELSPPSFTGAGGAGLASPRRPSSCRTNAVKNNGFNPVWEEELRIPFECVGDIMDLVFVRFVVRRQEDKDQEEPLAVYCALLGSLVYGYSIFLCMIRNCLVTFLFLEPNNLVRVLHDETASPEKCRPPLMCSLSKLCCLRDILKGVAEICELFVTIELRMSGGSLVVIYEVNWARAEDGLRWLGLDEGDGQSEGEDDDHVDNDNDSNRPHIKLEGFSTNHSSILTLPQKKSNLLLSIRSL